VSQESTNRSFDDLARALAEGSLSRRRALKLFAGTALAALIPSRALADESFEGMGLAEANVSWALSAPPPPPDCSSSLQTLINNAPAGSTLTVPKCTYRETVTVNKALTIDGQGQASLRGSDVWNNFSASGGNWVSSQSVPTLHTETRDICAPASDQRCKLPEQVYIDGSPQYQLATGSTPAAGQFALNASRQVVLGTDPTSKTVEVTTRQSILKAGASGVTVKGLDMRHSGNQAQTGAVSNNGFNNFTLEGCSVLYGHGCNVNMSDATGQKLIDTIINYAGQLGLGSDHASIEVTGGEMAYNNTEEFSSGFEAGALKVTDQGSAGDVNNVLFDGVHVHDNDGSGIWIDIDVRNTTIQNNRIHDNIGFGIFFEVSDGAEIANNIAYNNGTEISGWGWGAQIGVINSRNVEVHDNVVAWGADGISVISQERTDWPDYQDVTGVTVHHNTILRNSDGVNGFGLAWLQDWAGVLYDAGSANQGYDNAYWYPAAEGGGDRFSWSSSTRFLSTFNSTPGEERGRYLTNAEKDAVLATYSIPAP
jgi:parallel beta-helix repeat protein